MEIFSNSEIYSIANMLKIIFKSAYDMKISTKGFLYWPHDSLSKTVLGHF